MLRTIFSAAALLAAFAAVAVAVAVVFAAPAAAANVTVVQADRTAFRVTMSDGRVLHSPDLVGARLTIVLNGRPRRIRIDAVERDPDATRGDVWLHDFSVQTPDGGWENACLPGPDGRRQGFPVAGRSQGGVVVPAEPGVMEITCTAGAQGKCIRFGYLPWEAEGRDQYNTCIRMVRADYCGDGAGTTRNGMRIDLYDDHAIQRPDNAQDQDFEAGWTAAGAVCVRHVRVKENVSLESLVAACPRLRDRVGPVCTEDTARSLGARLFNRSKP